MSIELWTEEKVKKAMYYTAFEVNREIDTDDLEQIYDEASDEEELEEAYKCLMDPIKRRAYTDACDRFNIRDGLVSIAEERQINREAEGIHFTREWIEEMMLMDVIFVRRNEYGLSTHRLEDIFANSDFYYSDDRFIEI